MKKGQNYFILTKEMGKILIRRIGQVVRISLEKGFDCSSDFKELQEVMEGCFQRGERRLILDMKGVDFPSGSFIAFLIEATSRARKEGGDLRLINLSTKAKNNLISFNPLSYLSVEADEESALKSYGPSKEEVSGHSIQVESRVDRLYKICDFVTGWAEKAGMDRAEISKVKIAVYEAAINVVEHAYHFEPNHFIDVSVDYDNTKFVIVMIDNGDSFNLSNIKPYDVEEAMDERRTGGFGLYIIQRSMDEVKYESDPIRGNKLTMVKYL